MASVVLRSVGSAAGNALLPGIGGAFLGGIGRGVGGLVDGQLGLGSHFTGPRLENLGVQDSRYGAPIPIVYGEARVAGNVIWATDLIETEHSNSFSGGKGGLTGSSATSSTYTYSVHCAVGICAGPIGGIATIWADSTVIYQNGVWTSGVVDSASIYPGGTAQAPDAFMESILGTGNAPANRGLAYIVLENLQLANFGNRIPNLTFQILPVPANSDPAWLGGTDAGLSQRFGTVESGGMMPIALQGNAEITSVLVGGYSASGSTCAFQVAAYDVSGDTPAQLARAASGTFTASDVVDTSWALAPDQRYVALYLQNGASVTHRFAIYDSVTGAFGDVLGVDMAAGSSATKQIAWIDPQHFVIDDSVGGVRGLHVFARAGMNIIDLGFWGVWGAGSATSTATYFYGQFAPFAGGLMNYIWDVTVPATITIYARPLSWQNNALIVGNAYTVNSGLATGTGGGPTGNLLRTGDEEWTFFYGTADDYRLFSFVPGAASASITRPWQVFTPSFGTGWNNFPIYYGDRIVVLQRAWLDSEYSLSEVMLGSGGYTLGLDAARVSGSLSDSSGFAGMALDNARILLLGAGGFDYDITQFGLIRRCDTGSGLDAIMSDILGRAGYASGDYDVSALSGVTVDGYVLQDATTARAAIEPLQVFAPFDLVESATQLRAVPRTGTASVTIAGNEWRAAMDGQEPPPALDVLRAQELDLPVEVDVDYIDKARDFEVNSQRARRIATQALAVQKIALPIVCESDAAKQIAETRLYTLWAERELVRITISRRWLALDPGDVVDLGNGSLLRVTRVKQAGGLMQIEGFYVYAAALGSAAAGDFGNAAAQNVAVPLNTSLYLMDLPLLQSADDQPGVYVAAAGLAGWTGASLWRAADDVNFSNLATLSSMAIAGIAVTVPENVSALYPDMISTVEVQLMSGSLSSCSQGDLYNGANAALLGEEIIQFQTAALIGPGLYQLSGLLRGRRATEYAVATHAVGENFVLLTSGTVKFVPALLTDRGGAYDFRALTRGQSLSDGLDAGFTYNLITLQPFSPVNIAGARASGTGSDLALTWMRRARLNAEWVDYVDVPLDEPDELYDVEIMNGGSVMRTFPSLTAPTVTYTAAEQSADWGAVPATFTVNVYQIGSRYGRGQKATAVI